MKDPSATVAWLIGAAPAEVGELVRGLGARIVAAGVPVDRMNLSLMMRHPQVASRIAIWTPTSFELRVPPRSVLGEGRFLDSPIATVMAGADAVRCRLVGPDARLDYPICRELAAEGFTDYTARALRCSDGGREVMTAATRADGGFAAAQLEHLDALLPALALRVELASAHLATRSLLEVYLGPNAAARVLAGEFVRGSGTPIRAVVWTCDLRGFTALSDRRPPLEVTRLLDAYFERVVAAVTRHGGEVLKFIGDALLAVFPAGDDPAPACARGVAAAREAVAAIAAMDATSDEALAIGVALHLGEVFYGNIGGADRLDFTVIGASVNEVCRLESLCKRLGVAIVMSAEVREHLADRDPVDLGEHALPGVRRAPRVFGLPG